MIVFIHIPRTGGGSIHRTLAPHIPGATFPGAVWADNPGLQGVNWAGYHYAVGHWGASVLDSMPNPVAFTILRDPIARVLSHYSYVHEFGYHRDPAYCAFAKHATLRQWLDSPYSARAANNLQTRFLCDRDRDDIDEALGRLEAFAAIGFFEDGVEANANLLADLLDIPRVPVMEHINQTQQHLTIKDIGPDMLNELIDRNTHDIELWQMAKEMVM